MSTKSDEVHRRVREYRPPAFADYMDEVYAAMPAETRDWLPSETWQYVNHLVQYGLNHLNSFADALKKAVVGVYWQSPEGERFLPDPVRTTSVVEADLFIDIDGELVSVTNPELIWVRQAGTDRQKLEMRSYQSYEVLTGRLAGRRFDRFSRPLPKEPPLTTPATAIGGSPHSVIEGLHPSVPGDRSEYDVALSFAGEDRKYAEQLAALLLKDDFRVFYDRHERASLWGEDLYEHLTNIYQRKARYCVMFLSANYNKKLWTRLERRAALARAFTESRSYILPIRLDDAEIPGVLETTAYIDLRDATMSEVYESLVDKLRSHQHS